MYDEYLSQLYEEHVEEFTSDRLTAYYVENMDLAKPVFGILSQAKSIAATNQTAGYILSAIAIEVSLKSLLLKPMVYGLVHSESTASFIADLTINHAGLDRYRKLLYQILSEHGGIELDSIKRDGSDKKMIDEIMITIIPKRNRIMHRAETAAEEETTLAISVAAEILEKIFPTLINKLSLHIHEDYQICNDGMCKYKSFMESLGIKL